MSFSFYKQNLKVTITAAIYTDNFFKFHRTEPNVVDNFKPVAPTFTIAREKLIVKLNTAPRIPPEVIKPTSKVTNKSNNVTIRNETSPSKNITKNENLVSQVHVIHV